MGILANFVPTTVPLLEACVRDLQSATAMPPFSYTV